MKYKHTKKHMEIVNEFFAQPVSQHHMKAIGNNGNVLCNWNDGTATVDGKGGRIVLQLDDILDAYYKHNPDDDPAFDGEIKQ